VIAFCFAAMLFSLAGIPPLAGFFAKLYVFAAAIEARLFGLVVIGALTTVIGAYYYVRIVKVMYFDEPAGAFEPMPGNLRLVLAVSSALVLLFWLPGVPSWIVGAADAAARSLF
jgi:NADH-quinone oxidoreductase subunit N